MATPRRLAVTLPAALGVLATLAFLIDCCRPIFITREVESARIQKQSGEHEVSIYHWNGEDPPYWTTEVVCDVEVDGLGPPIRCDAGESCCALVEGRTYHLRVGQRLINRAFCDRVDWGHCLHILLAPPEPSSGAIPIPGQAP